jgi:hypothetical protein
MRKFAFYPIIEAGCLEILRALFFFWSHVIAKTVTEVAMTARRPIQIAKLSMRDMIVPRIVV